MSESPLSLEVEALALDSEPLPALAALEELELAAAALKKAPMLGCFDMIERYR